MPHNFRTVFILLFFNSLGSSGLDVGQEDSWTGLGNAKCIVDEMVCSSSTRNITCLKLIYCSCPKKMVIGSYNVHSVDNKEKHRRQALTLVPGIH
jgi:hypothetical protein